MICFISFPFPSKWSTLLWLPVLFRFLFVLLKLVLVFVRFHSSSADVQKKSHACFFVWCSKQRTHLFSRAKSSGSFTKKCEGDPIKIVVLPAPVFPLIKSGASVKREKSTVSLIKGPKFLSCNFSVSFLIIPFP